jgi:hypothetical protein
MSDDAHPGSLPGGRLGSNHNLHILPQAREHPEETVSRESSQTTPEEQGDLGLRKVQELTGSRLGQTPGSNEIHDAKRQVGLGKFLVGTSKPQVRKDVPAAALEGRCRIPAHEWLPYCR